MAALFDDVRYYLHRSLAQHERDELYDTMFTNGGREAESPEEATHIVTESTDVGVDMEKEGNGIHLVTPVWVRRCVGLGIKQEERFYSPDPRMLFSGIIGCASDLPMRDVEVIQAGIVGLGGQWRGPLTKEVTHLFVLSPTGEKYATAIKHQHRTGMKIVLPHWFDDSFKAAHLVPTRMYEFPDPPLFAPVGSQDGTVWKAGQKQVQLFRSLNYAKADLDMSRVEVKHKDLFRGQRVKMSDSLNLTAQRKEAFEARIRDAGGIIVETASKANVLITPFQEGHEFYQAFQKKKTIGTLEWIVYILRDGRLSNPREQLMHFPHPRGACGDFSIYEMTVTNYTGPARDYVKLLIETLGAKFTPTMSGATTHVIAGYCHPNEPTSAKISRAEEWNIPVVNHLWLEDCFVEWRERPLSGEKYAMRNVEWSGILGDKRQVEVHIPKEEVLVDNESETEPEPSPAKSTKSVRLLRSVQSPSSRRATSSHPPPDADVEMDPVEPLHPEDEDEVDRLVSTPAGTASGSAALRRGSSLFRPETPIPAPPTSSPSVASSKRRAPSSSPEKSGRAQKRSKLVPESSPRTDFEIVNISSDEDEDNVPTQKPVSKSTSKPTFKHTSKPASSTSKPTSSKSTSRLSKMHSPSPDLPDDPMDGIDLEVKAAPIPRPRRTGKAAPLPVLSDDEEEAPPAGTSRRTRQVTHSVRPVSAKRITSPSSPVDLPASDLPSSGAAANTSFEGRPRRGAAVLAESKLQEAMADANSFAKEMRGKRTGHLGDLGRIKLPEEMTEIVDLLSDDDADETDEDSHPPAKEHNNGRKRGRPSKEMKEKNTVPEKQKPTVKSGASLGPPGKRAAAASEADEDNTATQVERPKKLQPQKANGGTIAKNSAPAKKSIKAITTQVVLTQQELKKIQELGVEIIADPRDCTHVITKGISRTEKFLVAMANAPKFVTKQWVDDSIREEKLLPEDRYQVHDKAKEKDYGFRLSEALKRAQQGKVMEGQKFHITPAVKVDFGALKKIIEACGGKAVKVQQPLSHELDEDHHIVSCMEDVKFWKALASEGTTVYSQELILTGALTQQMGWDDDANKVEGASTA